MVKIITILLIFYIALKVSGCKKDSVQPNSSQLTISNLEYTPKTVTPGSTFTIQGSVDFSNAAGGVSKFRLTTSTGSDLTVPVPANSQANGTLSGLFEVTFPAAAGNFTFQVWIIDNGGNVSNKLQGSVQVVIDDEGKTWRKVLSSWNLSKVIWAYQRFLAVGYTGAIVTSTDPGHSWTQHNSGTDSWLRGVAWSGKQYIVVGSRNTILSSPDGTTWTSRSVPGVEVWFSSVAWSGNGFVSAGFKYSPDVKTAIFNSSDGNTWTENTFGVENGQINAVIWANNQYVAVGGANGLPIIFTSSDGLSWTNRTNASGFGKGVSLNDITWTGSKYVAVGFGLAATSSDGITWSVNDNVFTMWKATGVAWSGHKLIATSGGGEIYSSTDGLNWSQTYNASYPLESITWSGFQYVSVGAPQPIILVSPN